MPGFTDTDICNQALSHIGVGTEISDLDTDRSQEGSACRRFLEVVRQIVLRDFQWTFTTVTEDLALVEDFASEYAAGTITEPPEWAFSYRYPAGAVAVRRILSGSRVDSNGTKVPFRIGQDADGRLIYTDREDAQIEYSKLEDNTDLYDADVVDLMALLLGSRIAPRFGPEAKKLGNDAALMYERRRWIAQANAVNEEVPDQPPDSDFILARDG